VPPVSTAATGRSQVTLEGVFSMVIGDPPASGGTQARSIASLRVQDQNWQLVFDDGVYRYPGNLLQLGATRVRVTGVVTGPNLLIVTSLTPL
jgi:hypothetical protein